MTTLFTPDEARTLMSRLRLGCLEQFLVSYPGAALAPGDEPIAAWNQDQRSGCVEIGEYVGPHAEEPPAPLPLLPYIAVNGRAVRRSQEPDVALCGKLGLSDPPRWADRPALTLLATVDEVVPLGIWLASWLEAQQLRSSNPPATPFSMMYWDGGWHELEAVGEHWLDQEFLATKNAKRHQEEVQAYLESTEPAST